MTVEDGLEWLEEYATGMQNAGEPIPEPDHLEHTRNIILRDMEEAA
jgi:hypothetical protein